MANDAIVKNLQAAILATSRQKLGRDLTETERNFIESRGGYVALEMILDRINVANAAEIAGYLNSETAQQM